MNQGMAFPLAVDVAELCRDKRPTTLLIAQGAEGQQVAMIVESAGGRLLGTVSVAEALARLDRIADVDLVLFHCSAPHPDTLRLLARLDAMMAVNDTGLLVITDLDGLDLVYPHVRAATPLLCDPSDAELAAAILLGLRARATEPHLCDISKDSDARRMERLSEEVSRLARTLDALMGTGPVGDAAGNRAVAPALSHATAPWLSERQGAYVSQVALTPAGTRGAESLQGGHVREMLRARRLRDQFLPGELFADPAWDMMLDLMAARLSGERVSVSSLCIAAAVPPTTALRWIRQLTERGIFVREADIADGRRVFIALSDDAAASISGWFQACRRVLRGSSV